MTNSKKTMSRYFLHLCERSASVFDGEGIDVADEAAAIERAVWTIRDVVANDVLAGQTVGLGSYVSIQNESGSELRRVFFRDVIRFIDEPLIDCVPRQPD